jgi:predicted permease
VKLTGDADGATRFRFWLWLIRVAGVIVPRRFRSDWRQEWEAELRYREALLREWDQLNRRARLALLWYSAGALMDALSLQPRRWEDEVIQDLRYGIRLLLKRPGFCLVALFSLALGTGANTAIFSLVNTVLLRPLPVEKPEQLVALNNTARQTFPSFSYPNYKDFRDRNDVFAGLIAYRFAPLSLSHDGVNERVWGYEVSGDYFDVLGVKAALGRTILPDDDRIQEQRPVTVLSHKCWQRRFGGDPSVIGKEIIVNGGSYKIIGVAPQGFFGTEVLSAAELWFPLAMQAQLEAGNSWLDERRTENIFVQGRLKPGVTSARAEAALNQIAMQLEREFPDVNEDKRVTLSPAGLIGNFMRGPVLGMAGLLMVVVGLVLLLACTNLANLLLARTTERRREIAVRLAVGASRFRLVRQLLTESLLLGLFGGALGLLPALWLVNLATTFKMPVNVPVAFDFKVDHRVYLFTLVLSFTTGVLFGLLPALQATKSDLVPALKDDVSFGGPHRSWLKSSLIVLQVALSLVLLIGGGLMIRALRHAGTINLGFDPQNAAAVSFNLRLQGYDNAQGREFHKRLLERVRAIPGVQYAGITDLAPVDLHFSRARVFIEGRTLPRDKEAPLAMFNRAGSGYFQAMKTRLLQGRDFVEQDDENSPRVAIINETFARQFFLGEDPIGRRFSVGSAEGVKTQIIGVVQDGKYANLGETPKPFFCRSIWQSEVGDSNIIVRSTDDPQRMIAAVRSEVQQLDPNLPIAGSTLVDKLSLPLLPARAAAYMFGSFGMLALALAAIGIYGVMSYAIATRTHEIGIRMALGARAHNVLFLVMRQGVTLTVIGVLLGLGAALALTRLMSGLLFGVSATDPLTFILTSTILAAVAFVACYAPARRATRVDPLAALRHE